jgi:hypothetical protein
MLVDWKGRSEGRVTGQGGTTFADPVQIGYLNTGREGDSAMAGEVGREKGAG